MVFGNLNNIYTLCCILRTIFEYSSLLNYEIPTVKKSESPGSIQALKTRCSHLVNTILFLYSSNIGERLVFDPHATHIPEENYWYKVRVPSVPSHYFIITFQNNMVYRFEAFWKMQEPLIDISPLDIEIQSLSHYLEHYEVTRYRMICFNESRASAVDSRLHSLLTSKIISDDVKSFMLEKRDLADFAKKIKPDRKISNNCGIYDVIP
jgi:hypothetical protein